MSRTAVVLSVLALIAVGVVGRLIPHLPNATPMTALIAVSSTILGKRWALIVPLVTLALSDFVIGLYDWHIMLSVYASFALIGVTSWYTRRRSSSALWLILIGPLLFFIVTNAAVWAFSPWYEKSLQGLWYAYEMGLPFLKSMMLGDLVYVSLSILIICISKSRSAREQRKSALQRFQSLGFLFQSGNLPSRTWLTAVSSLLLPPTSGWHRKKYG